MEYNLFWFKWSMCLIIITVLAFIVWETINHDPEGSESLVSFDHFRNGCPFITVYHKDNKDDLAFCLSKECLELPDPTPCIKENCNLYDGLLSCERSIWMQFERKYWTEDDLS